MATKSKPAAFSEYLRKKLVYCHCTLFRKSMGNGSRNQLYTVCVRDLFNVRDTEYKQRIHSEYRIVLIELLSETLLTFKP